MECARGSQKKRNGNKGEEDLRMCAISLWQQPCVTRRQTQLWGIVDIIIALALHTHSRKASNKQQGLTTGALRRLVLRVSCSCVRIGSVNCVVRSVMGALGSLGVGLSVLFGIFLAVLAGEVYYMLCCSRSKGRGRGPTVAGAAAGVAMPSSTSRRSRVSSVQAEGCADDDASTGRGPGRGGGGEMEAGRFAREASLVGSFGGYPAPAHSNNVLVSKLFPPHTAAAAAVGLYDDVFPHTTFLFPIAEETKEELQAAAAAPQLSKVSSVASSHEEVATRISNAVVVVVSPSSSSSTSSTPFATPPSSPSSPDDSEISLLLSSPATAASRFSANSWSPVSASSSPATAALKLYTYSQSPSSVGASPAATAKSWLSSVNSPSPVAGAANLSSTPSSSVHVDGGGAEHGPLGSLFRRQSNSQSRYSPLRPVICIWPGGASTDFRHALPVSPPSSRLQLRSMESS